MGYPSNTRVRVYRPETKTGQVQRIERGTLRVSYVFLLFPRFPKRTLDAATISMIIPAAREVQPGNLVLPSGGKDHI